MISLNQHNTECQNNIYSDCFNNFFSLPNRMNGFPGLQKKNNPISMFQYTFFVWIKKHNKTQHQWTAKGDISLSMKNRSQNFPSISQLLKSAVRWTSHIGLYSCLMFNFTHHPQNPLKSTPNFCIWKKKCYCNKNLQHQLENEIWAA